MALLDRIRERTGSDLSDAELGAMIVAIAVEIAACLGPAGPVSVELGDPGDPDSRFRRSLRLTRPADAGQAIAIVETWPGNSGAAANQVTLAAGDYALRNAGRTLIRLSDGPNGAQYWAPLVRVGYSPVGDQALRDETTIKLIQLDLSYRGGLKSERAGDYQFTLSGDPVADREAILASLATRVASGGMVMA